jgi:hypothetical protein
VGIAGYGAYPQDNGGNGGTGIVSSITGSRLFYAGGGGGGTRFSAPNGGIGGGGGGGNSATSLIVATTGTINTGGGGGGGCGTANVFGAAGGSGVVIIRYPSYLAPATSTTGGPEMYVAGAWRVYKFVASGTITF